jgi:uncharacterized protein
MSVDVKATLSALKGIAAADTGRVRLLARKQKIIDDVMAKRRLVEKAMGEAANKRRVHQEKKLRYEKEEKRLKHEQEKLVDRRKALSVVSNYKLQVAAGKEIEMASRTLSHQEEALITVLVDIDALDKAASEAEAAVLAVNSEFEAVAKDAEGEIIGIDERAQKYEEERQEFLSGVGAPELKLYEKVAKRYPVNPIVGLVNNCCEGCHMQLGPQAVVELMRFAKIVECRSCGRLLTP